MCPSLYLWELLVKQANTRTLKSNTKNVLQIPLTNLKRFGDRTFCAYAQRLEFPDDIKATDSGQNFKKQLKTLLFRKEFISWNILGLSTSNQMEFISYMGHEHLSTVLNIIGGKGAISNINYYYYH